jgi:hypothetical protein
VSVKTLIWELVLAEREKPCYFATTLRYRDRVDEEKLKEYLLQKESPSIASQVMASFGETPKTSTMEILTIVSLTLAETDKAEKLTGYMSGVIPPMGHVKPVVLILDQELSCDPSIRFSLGSGSFQHSLQMSLSDLLDYANVLSAGVHFASISNQSNTQEEDEALVVGAIEEPKCSTDPGRQEEEEDEVVELTKKLRDACLHKGKLETIKSVIKQAGDRFPEVRNE